MAINCEEDVAAAVAPSTAEVGAAEVGAEVSGNDALLAPQFFKAPTTYYVAGKCLCLGLNLICILPYLSKRSQAIMS